VDEFETVLYMWLKVKRGKLHEVFRDSGEDAEERWRGDALRCSMGMNVG